VLRRIRSRPSTQTKPIEINAMPVMTWMLNCSPQINISKASELTSDYSKTIEGQFYFWHSSLLVAICSASWQSLE
jgi:hypothetical protein